MWKFPSTKRRFEREMSEPNELTIDGKTFRNPKIFPPSKRDFREYKEGARTTVKELWVERYDKTPDGKGIFMTKYQVLMTNRGVCTFDGKQVKDEEGKRKIQALFTDLKTV